MPTLFDLVPFPNFGSPYDYNNPQHEFQSEGGYRDARNAWSNWRFSWVWQWTNLTQAQINTIRQWLDEIRSDTFQMIDPATDGPSPETYLCRIKAGSFKHTPRRYDGSAYRYDASLTIEQV